MNYNNIYLIIIIILNFELNKSNLNYYYFN